MLSKFWREFAWAEQMCSWQACCRRAARRRLRTGTSAATSSPPVQGQLGSALTDTAPPCSGSDAACTPGLGADSSASCPTGRYLVSGDQACALCPAGSSCAGGSADPALCPAGQYAERLGLPACRLCGVDQYQVMAFFVAVD